MTFRDGGSSRYDAVLGSEVLDRLSSAIESRSWHWFGYHAGLFRRGVVHPLFISIMNAVTLAEERLPGLSELVVTRIGTTGGTRNNFARLLGEAGQIQEALTQFQQLLTDQTRVLGPDHPNTLTTREHVSYWLGRAGA